MRFFALLIFLNFVSINSYCQQINPSQIGTRFYGEAGMYIRMRAIVNGTKGELVPKDSILKDLGIVDSFLVKTNNNQNISGSKTFTRQVIAQKGIKSDSTIETKGLNTEGSLEKVAMNVKGAIKTSRKIIISDYTLNGTDPFIEIRCEVGDIIIVCPPLNSEFNGMVCDIIRTDDTNFIVSFLRPDGSSIRILNKRSARLRNNGTNWNFD